MRLARAVRLACALFSIVSAPALLLVNAARGQCLPTQPCAIGQWDGPWDWGVQVSGGASAVPPYPATCGTAEFSHAAVIPTGAYRGKVLLWRQDVGWAGGVCAPLVRSWITVHAWIFDPALQGVSPSGLLIKIDQILDSDIFCSGASWDPDGELIIAGGVGPTSQDLKETYRFRPSFLGTMQTDPATGWPFVPVNPATPPSLKIGDMAVKHYYPTAFHIAKRNWIYGTDATVSCGTLVAGGSCLVFGGPGEDPYQGVVKGNEVWDILPPALNAWACPIVPITGLSNPWTILSFDKYDVIDTPSAPPTEVLLDSYPRMRQLTGGDLFIAADVDSVEYPTIHFPTSTQPVLNRPGHTWKVTPRQSGTPQNRWLLEKGPSPGSETADPTNDRFYVPGAFLHKLGAPSSDKDRFLVFGGSMDANYFGSVGLGFPPGGCPNWVVLNTVQEYQSSDLFQPWKPKAAMQRPRMTHNAVILPTGQVLLVGGTSTDDYNHEQYPVVPGNPPTCQIPPTGATPEFQPELYDPGSTPNALGSSTLMAESNLSTTVNPPKRTPRLYHHVGCLLPDGRVFVAGGKPPYPMAGSPNPQFSGELFSPPYLFQSFRPVVSRLFPPNQAAFSSTGAQVTFQFQATLKTGNVPDGVVLLRPAALTHHFDDDQIYIELVNSSVQVSTSPTMTQWLFTVTSPMDNLGPAGWYMLFVIEKDPATGIRVPSVGEFIRFF